MSDIQILSSLSIYFKDGFEIKTAYASKGMHFILLQKGERIVMASTNSMNVEYGNDMFYEDYEVRELTERKT